MQCFCPGAKMNRIEKAARSSEISKHSSTNGEIKQHINNIDTEEADFPLQEGGSLKRGKSIARKGRKPTWTR
ncbi:Os03g0138000 [Oryza sativa Japonica Group]|uniref:Os03g0138000 protein n=1 Tax=Oryza sativa subsp. japonica TaxID=39947 RepID=A0A0N7KGJ6_ORYSJ|nr:hypothetical protein EE612_015188 [Oryza sativa]BAS82201.1 Os03g0138000 [Oryza sativa Japonica Group]